MNNEKNSSSRIAKICKAVGSLILFVILASAVAQFIAWMKRGSGRENDNKNPER